MFKIKIAILVSLVALIGLVVHSNKTVTKSATPKPPAKAAAINYCAAATTDKSVLVSISKQHMWACEGTNEVYDAAVTTGASAYPEDATLTGTWHIQGKQANRYLTGSDSRGSWNEHVNYWIPYDGDYGFHDAPWQTFPYGDLNKYKTEGSHGCVRSSTAALKWLYDWSAVDTTVIINS